MGTGDEGYVTDAKFDVSNNVIVGSKYGIVAAVSGPGSISTQSTFRNNLVHGNQIDWYYDDHGITKTLMGAGMTVTGTVTTDPGFVAPASGNYRLAAGSAAIDEGFDLGPAIDVDMRSRPYGAARDIVAYEWRP